MVKQRFSTCDVVAEISCLKQKVLGMRLANLYDINHKTYLLKLARSGDEGEKVFVVLESGSRFHTTQWSKDKADTPSNFTLKLRKHLRTRRLEDVRQLGVDRIIDFSFGSGEACHHLILELFSQGNVILTDAKYEILTLLRSHRDDAKGVAIMARHPYPLQTVRLARNVTPDLLEEALMSDSNATLRSMVLAVLPYGAALADHLILSAGLSPQSVCSVASNSEEVQAALLDAVQMGENILAAFTSEAPKGFIWQVKQGSKKASKAATGEHIDDEDAPLVYEEFDALPLNQHKTKSVLQFDTFDAALDEFYAKIEGQRAQQVQVQQEQAVMSKVEKIRLDQTKRAAALEREASEEELKATLIEYNLEAVDGAIAAVRGALASGLNWKELKRLIKTERDAGNPVASIIHSLELEQNRVVLLLSNFLDEEEGDDDAITRPATKVEIDLDLNAYANARSHYESRKAKAAKQQKTVEQNIKALKAAEKTAQQKLTKVTAARTAQQLRKPYWFEKFNWFITSENYLVISGRDMQQNELLVKRYLKKGDIYVHAELHGAATTVVKNHSPDMPVPQLSITQAGSACVCRSKAWDAKIVTSAWWVKHDQVSKTAPTGEYLPTGSFIIRGKKNFLPPQPLIMGLSFLFRLDESSLAGHVGERAVRGLDGEISHATDTLELAEVAEEIVELQGAESPETQMQGGPLHKSALDAFMEGAVDPLKQSNVRYSLPEPSDQQQRESEIEGTQTGKESCKGGPSEGRRHLSAKERRTMKKGGVPGGPSVIHTDAVALAEARKTEAARREAKQQADLRTNSEAAAAAVRGKRGKTKKAQTKYAHQDEEDRSLALQLLDPAGKQKGKAEKREARKARKQDHAAGSTTGLWRLPPTTEELERVGAHMGAPRQIPHSSGKQDQLQTRASSGTSDRERDAHSSDCSITPMLTHSSRVESTEADKAATMQSDDSHRIVEAERAERQSGDDEGTDSSSLSQGGDSDVESTSENHSADNTIGVGSSQSNGILQQMNSGQDQEAAEVAALLEEEHVELLPEAELQRLREIDGLTGQPRAEDILLHAVPVCAPYSTLQSYKYRLKLTPGTQRKGKAGKQAVELLVRSPEIPAKEKELIRSIPDMEIINAMIGAVKISMPGLQKIKSEARTQKKKKKGAS